MTDNPAPFLNSTGKESGHIYERHYRDIEAVTGLMNLAALTSASISYPARTEGWFPTTPTGTPSSLAKPTTMFSAYRGKQLKEAFVIDNLSYHPSHVIRPVRIKGDQFIHSLALSLPLVPCGQSWGLCHCMVGRNDSISAAMSNAPLSLSETMHATRSYLHDGRLPSVSSSTSPEIISGMTYGLLMNILPLCRPSITKSESPAASALVPETVPRTMDRIGTFPSRILAGPTSHRWGQDVTPSWGAARHHPIFR